MPRLSRWRETGGGMPLIHTLPFLRQCRPPLSLLQCCVLAPQRPQHPQHTSASSLVPQSRLPPRLRCLPPVRSSRHRNLRCLCPHRGCHPAHSAQPRCRRSSSKSLSSRAGTLFSILVRGFQSPPVYRLSEGRAQATRTPLSGRPGITGAARALVRRCRSTGTSTTE